MVSRGEPTLVCDLSCTPPRESSVGLRKGTCGVLSMETGRKDETPLWCGGLLPSLLLAHTAWSCPTFVSSPTPSFDGSSAFFSSSSPSLLAAPVSKGFCRRSVCLPGIVDKLPEASPPSSPWRGTWRDTTSPSCTSFHVVFSFSSSFCKSASSGVPSELPLQPSWTTTTITSTTVDGCRAAVFRGESSVE